MFDTSKEFILKLTATTRADLAEMVHKRSVLSRQQSAAVTDGILRHVANALVSGESVKIIRFGTFVVLETRPRTGRNVSTSEQMVFSGRRTVAFRPSRTLLELVAAGKS